MHRVPELNRIHEGANPQRIREANDYKNPAGALRGRVSTQIPQPGGDTAKRRGGCAGRKSRRPDELKCILTTSN